MTKSPASTVPKETGQGQQEGTERGLAPGGVTSLSLAAEGDLGALDLGLDRALRTSRVGWAAVSLSHVTPALNCRPFYL